jgi:hypothetical protein
MSVRNLLSSDFSKNKNHYYPGDAIIAIEDVGTSFTSIPSRSIYTESGVEFGSNVEFVEAQTSVIDSGTMFTLRRDTRSVTFTLSFTTREVYFATWNLSQGGSIDDAATLGSMTGKQITVDGDLPPEMQFRIVLQQPDTQKYVVITIPKGQSSDIANLTKDDYQNIPVSISANIDATDTDTYPTIFFQD